MIPVTLSREEELGAALIGFFQQAVAVAHGRPPRHRSRSLWEGHIEGSLSEKAASIATGLPWTGGKVWTQVPGEKLPDLGTESEVRWVAPRRDGAYLLNFDPEKDNPDRIFYLVSGFSPEFQVHGWVQGCDCEERGERTEYPERVVHRVHVRNLEPLT